MKYRDNSRVKVLCEYERERWGLTLRVDTHNEPDGTHCFIQTEIKKLSLDHYVAYAALQLKIWQQKKLFGCLILEPRSGTDRTMESDPYSIHGM